MWHLPTLPLCAGGPRRPRSSPSSSAIFTMRTTSARWGTTDAWPQSSEDLAHDAAVHVGEPKITARIAIRQPFVVEPHKVQDRRVQVVHVDTVLHGAIAELVRGAMGHAAPDTGASQPNAEAPVIMIAALRGPAVHQFHGRCPSELAAA